MEAIVLAGGLGTRLRSVISDLPKPMAPVAGRPFLEILLTMLGRAGVGRVVLSVGYRADAIRAHFGDSFRGIELDYAIEEQPLGTGGAIRWSLEHCKEDHVFIFNGDTFLDLEIGAVEAFWQSYRQPIIVAREVPDTERYGRIEMNGDRFTGFTEKGLRGPGPINAGCYVFPRNLLNRFAPGDAFSLETDFLAQAVHQIPFRVFTTHGKFIDIGVPEDYARAQQELSSFDLQ